MDSDLEKVHSFTRRALVLGGIKGALMTTLAARLGWLQLVEGARLRTLAENNRVNVKLLAPSRGLIMDRNGIALAQNEQNFRVQIVPEQTEDIQGSLETLSQILPLRPSEIDAVLTRAQQQPDFLPIEIIENLSWEQVAAIEVNMPDLPGISIDVGQRRFYPNGPATAHVVGYVGSVAKGDQTGDPVLALPGFRVGKTGLEKAFDTDLRGEPGYSRIEVNVAGRMVRELERDAGVSGTDLSLTIDLDLQKKVQEILGAEKSSSAVLMDVHTGAVYAMASGPSFDPNLFTTGISQVMWDQLLNDEAHPLSNKAVGGQYPPGSTFKVATSMAGLDCGVITADTRVYCPGHYDVGDHRFHCWKPGGHGTVGVTQALEQSCDVFFYTVSRDIGIDRIADMAKRLGLGQDMGTMLPEERSGIVPDQKWKLKTFKKRWEPGETIVASIGQGYTLTTPLQLAVMTSRLVNGGKSVKPWIVARQNGRDTPEMVRSWPDMNLDPDHVAQVKAGMDAVVNGDHGTAKIAQPKGRDWTIGGKTGTAQVKRITMAQRSEGMVAQEDQPWKDRHHGLFIGYAPADNPRYVVAVVTEHGGGSGAASPLARDILVAAMDMNLGSKPVAAIPPHKDTTS